MKKVLMISLLLLILPLAYALEDIEIKVDSAEIGSNIEFVPGTMVKVEIVKNNVLFIKNIDVDSENPVIEQVFYNKLSGIGTHDSAIFEVPMEMPSGNFKTTLIFDYYDKEYVHKRYTKTTVIESEGGSGAAGGLSGLLSDEDAAELVNEQMNVQIERLDPELQHIELNKKDLLDLGIDVDDFVKGIELLQQGKRGEAAKFLPEINKVDSDKRTLVYEKQEIETKMLRQIKGKRHPDVKVVKNIYEVINDDKSIDKSKLTYSVTAEEENINGLELLLVVPKDIAKNVKMLDFSEEPEVIEEDPVIKWAFKNIPQGQTKDYSFTVSKDVQNFDTLAAAAADSPSWLSKLIKKIVGVFS
ncbi:MAG: hypothetical protein U9R08_05010 [Nanoarchaeota archaeon]|nr:hypothetical protein [Nanoarchaeota archaeon]